MCLMDSGSGCEPISTVCSSMLLTKRFLLLCISFFIVSKLVCLNVELFSVQSYLLEPATYLLFVSEVLGAKFTFKVTFLACDYTDVHQYEHCG